MVLLQGNKSSSNLNPGGSTQTLAHTQNTGADGFIIAFVTMPSSVNHSSATYGGESMTQLYNELRSSLSQRMVCYYLASPPTGSNDFVATYSGAQWSSTSIHISSFTGADSTIGNYGVSVEATSPHSRNITVSANSYIYATGCSVNSQSDPYTFDGNNMTTAFNGHNSNRIVEGAWYQETTAGTYAVVTKTASSTITNDRVEIKEASAAPTGKRRIIIC